LGGTQDLAINRRNSLTGFEGNCAALGIGGGFIRSRQIEHGIALGSGDLGYQTC